MENNGIHNKMIMNFLMKTYQLKKAIINLTSTITNEEEDDYFKLSNKLLNKLYNIHTDWIKLSNTLKSKSFRLSENILKINFIVFNLISNIEIYFESIESKLSNNNINDNREKEIKDTIFSKNDNDKYDSIFDEIIESVDDILLKKGD